MFQRLSKAPSASVPMLQLMLKRTKASGHPLAKALSGSSSQQIFDREAKFGAHNYHPLPVALCKGKGKQLHLIRVPML